VGEGVGLWELAGNRTTRNKIEVIVTVRREHEFSDTAEASLNGDRD